jgi:hypothetical protein
VQNRVLHGGEEGRRGSVWILLTQATPVHAPYLLHPPCPVLQVWHVLSAKNKHIFEEIRYKQPEQNSSQSAESSSSDISSGTHGGLESQGSSESVAVESNSSSRSSSSGSAGTSAE